MLLCAAALQYLEGFQCFSPLHNSGIITTNLEMPARLASPWWISTGFLPLAFYPTAIARKSKHQLMLVS